MIINSVRKTVTIFIETCILAMCVVLLTVNTSHAAVVLQEVSFLSGVGTSNLDFSITQQGKYKAEMVDFVFPTKFDEMGLHITDDSFNVIKEISSTTGGFTFTFEAMPGNYVASVFGDAGGSLDIGLYGLKVSQVPLPTALVMFVSGMLLLLLFTDKDREWKNSVLSMFNNAMSTKPA